MFLQKKYWIGLLLSLSTASLLAQNKQESGQSYRALVAQRKRKEQFSNQQQASRNKPAMMSKKRLTIIMIITAIVVIVCWITFYYFGYSNHQEPEEEEDIEEQVHEITEEEFKEAIATALDGNLDLLKSMRPKISDEILNGKIYEDENSEEVTPIAYIISQQSAPVLAILLEENDVVAQTKIPFVVCTSAISLAKKKEEYAVLKLLREKMDPILLETVLLYAADNLREINSGIAGVLLDTPDCKVPVTVGEELLKKAHRIVKPVYYSGNDLSQHTYFFKKLLKYTSNELLAKKIANDNTMSMLDDELYYRFEKNYSNRSEPRFKSLLSEKRYRDAQLLDFSEEGFKRVLLVNCVRTQYLSYLADVCGRVNQSVLDKKMFGMDKNYTALQHIAIHYRKKDNATTTDNSKGVEILQTILSNQDYKNHLFKESLAGLANATLAAMVSDEYLVDLEKLCKRVNKQFFSMKINSYFGNRTVLEYAMLFRSKKVISLLVRYGLEKFDGTEGSFKKIIELVVADDSKLDKLEEVINNVDIKILEAKLWGTKNALDYAIQGDSLPVIKTLLKNSTYEKKVVIDNTSNGFKRLLEMAHLGEEYLPLLKELRKKMKKEDLDAASEEDIFSETPITRVFYYMNLINWRDDSNDRDEELKRHVAILKVVLGNPKDTNSIEVSGRMVKDVIDQMHEYKERKNIQYVLKELVKHTSEATFTKTLRTNFTWTNLRNRLFRDFGQDMTLLEYAIMKRLKESVSILVDSSLNASLPPIPFKSFCFALLAAIDNPSEKVCLTILSTVVSKIEDKEKFFNQRIGNEAETVKVYVQRESPTIWAILEGKSNE